LLFAGLVAAAALSLIVTASSAQVPGQVQDKRIAIRLLPVPERVAQSDVVVVGKVTSIEDKAVSATLPGTDQKADYTIAVVKVGDRLFGTKDDTHVKVGFNKPAAGGGRPRPGGFGPPQLAVDQEAVFFLQKHPTESFYVMGFGPNSLVNKAGNDNFD